MVAKINGEVVPQGMIYVRESRNLKMAWNNTVWEEQLALKVQQVSPYVPGAELVLESAVLNWTLNCRYAVAVPCYSGGGAPTIGPVNVATLRGGLTTTARKGIVAPANSSMSGVSSWNFTAKATGYTDVNGNTGIAPVIRCDAEGGLRSKQGCSFNDVVPVMDYSIYVG